VHPPFRNRAKITSLNQEGDDRMEDTVTMGTRERDKHANTS
jgi:hypothetical protein